MAAEYVDDNLGFDGAAYHPVEADDLRRNADRYRFDVDATLHAATDAYRHIVMNAMPANTSWDPTALPKGTQLIPALCGIQLSRRMTVHRAPVLTKSESKQRRRRMRKQYAAWGVDPEDENAPPGVRLAFRSATLGVPTIRVRVEQGAWAQHYAEPTHDSYEGDEADAADDDASHYGSAAGTPLSRSTGGSPSTSICSSSGSDADDDASGSDAADCSSSCSSVFSECRILPLPGYDCTELSEEELLIEERQMAAEPQLEASFRAAARRAIDRRESEREVARQRLYAKLREARKLKRVKAAQQQIRPAQAAAPTHRASTRVEKDTAAIAPGKQPSPRNSRSRSPRSDNEPDFSNEFARWAADAPPPLPAAAAGVKSSASQQAQPISAPSQLNRRSSDVPSRSVSPVALPGEHAPLPTPLSFTSPRERNQRPTLAAASSDSPPRAGADPTPTSDAPGARSANSSPRPASPHSTSVASRSFAQSSETKAMVSSASPPGTPLIPASPASTREVAHPETTRTAPTPVAVVASPPRLRATDHLAAVSQPARNSTPVTPLSASNGTAPLATIGARATPSATVNAGRKRKPMLSTEAARQLNEIAAARVAAHLQRIRCLLDEEDHAPASTECNRLESTGLDLVPLPVTTMLLQPPRARQQQLSNQKAAAESAPKPEPRLLDDRPSDSKSAAMQAAIVNAAAPKTPPEDGEADRRIVAPGKQDGCCTVM
jgi:hypothetical protein